MLLLRRAQAGRGHDQRDPAFLTQRSDALGGLRDGEIDHAVRICVERGGQRDSQGIDPGTLPRITAQIRMAARLQGRHHLQVRIGRGQRDQPLAHAPGRSVNRQAKSAHA